MPTLKLWYSPGACSLAPHILLEESGLPYQCHRSNVFQGASDELKAINPKGQVPVLEMDNQIITEVSAIMTVIAQLAPDKYLLGRDNLDIIRSYEWFSYFGASVHKQSFGPIFRPGRYSDDTASHDNLRKQGKENVIECFTVIEKRLTGNHLVGDSFTASDAYFFVFYRWAAMFLKLDMARDFPKCTAVGEELIKRPVVAAVLQAEGLEALLQNL